MSKLNDFTIESIIKKYENRQQKLIGDLSREKKDQIDTARYSDQPFNLSKSGLSTPEFNYTINRKEFNKNFEEIHERTHKKESYNTPPINHNSIPFKNQSSYDRNQLQSLLKRLDQTEDKLAKSERNYAEIWRKYQKLLQQKQSGKELQMEQRLRHHQVEQLEHRILVLERQNKNYKQIITSKQSNIEVLREKLRQKNEKLIDSQKRLVEVKSETESIKAQRDNLRDKEEYVKKQRQIQSCRLRAQLLNLQQVSIEREKQKKNLSVQLQKNNRIHEEQILMLKNSHKQVQQQYKNWIQSCNNQKIIIIKQYEHQINQIRLSLHQAYSKLKLQASYEDDLSKKQKEINRLIAFNNKQTNDLKQLRIELQHQDADRKQLVLKNNSLQNEMMKRVQSHKALQSAYSKLVNNHNADQQKLKEMKEKYQAVNQQFIELKQKCSAIFQSMQETEKGSQAQNLEMMRTRKQLLTVKQQLQRSKNNESILNQRLSQAIKSMKNRIVALEQQKNQSTNDLLAERLENARLKQQIKETKQYLRKEYQLSIQNTRRELENQIGLTNSAKPRTNYNTIDTQKEELYLQMRALQRKYEQLESQIITIDDVVGIASKVQKRYEIRK